MNQSNSRRVMPLSNRYVTTSGAGRCENSRSSDRKRELVRPARALDVGRVAAPDVEVFSALALNEDCVRPHGQDARHREKIRLAQMRDGRDERPMVVASALVPQADERGQFGAHVDFVHGGVKRTQGNRAAKAAAIGKQLGPTGF